MNRPHLLGLEGENAAQKLLLKKGYQILERNYRFQKAEVDLIARMEDQIIFIEVKSRTTKWVAHLADHVNKKKIRLLVEAADNYVIQNEIDLEVRFDIITVLKTKSGLEMEHLEDAFYHF
ncbi:MAG: endonuclease [Eudoraea sp.]|nr:endonuclease [Eudoraea sp.]